MSRRAVLQALARLLYPHQARRKVQRGPLRGYTIVVGPGIGFSYIWNLDHAEWTWLRHVKPGDVVYDVGANCGQSTMHLAAAVGPTGRVVAFEPFVDHYKRLVQHVELNALAQVTPVCAALAGSDGDARFEFYADRPTQGRLNNPALQGIGGVPTLHVVPTLRLDGFEGRGWPVPTFLKIDVEGGARGVLAGAHETLRRHRPRFFIEMHDPDEQSAVSEVLRLHRYRALAEDGREVSDLGAAWNSTLYCLPLDV